jgi:hypothetical protein
MSAEDNGLYNPPLRPFNDIIDSFRHPISSTEHQSA